MLSWDAHWEGSPGNRFRGRAAGQQDPAPTRGDGWASGGDTSASGSRKGSRKGHRAEGLEPAHCEPEKQAAAGMSGASLLKLTALPQGRVLARGVLF